MSVLQRETISRNLRLEVGFTAELRPQIAALYLEAFGPKLGRLLGRGARAQRFLQASLDPDYAIVALSGGQIVGIAGYCTEQGGLTDPFRANLAAHYGPTGAAWRGAVLDALERPEGSEKLLVDGIAVHPDWRSAGIGTVLLGALEQRAIDLGKAAIRLDVIDRNLRARALYARLGYVQTGLHDLGLLRVAFGFRYATQMTKNL